LNPDESSVAGLGASLADEASAANTKTQGMNILFIVGYSKQAPPL
tara:strand:- start:226 stop:360 length:135 start_codon:yes stop_codon:yes gene_type:complete